jgi:integrase
MDLRTLFRATNFACAFSQPILNTRRSYRRRLALRPRRSQSASHPVRRWLTLVSRFPCEGSRGSVEEIVSVMRAAGDSLHGQRLRGLIVVLWRAGLRISEALALAESDIDARRGAVLVRRGKGGRRCEVGMDDWAWQELQPWLASRLELPVGPSSPARPAGDGGPEPQLAARSVRPRSSPEFAGASRHISSATRTRSRWLTRASR